MTELGYFSKVFSQPEARLSSRHREILALTYAIKNFEYHLIGVPFNSFIDHKSMLFLFKEHYRSQLTTKMHNCLVYLQNFEMKLIHVNGDDPRMASADCLSRLPIKSLEQIEKESQTAMRQFKLIDNLIDKIAPNGKKIVLSRELAIEFLSYLH